MFQSFSFKFVERYKTAICLNEQVILHRLVIWICNMYREEVATMIVMFGLFTLSMF